VVDKGKVKDVREGREGRSGDTEMYQSGLGFERKKSEDVRGCIEVVK
jgi:hypothetical protein